MSFPKLIESLNTIQTILAHHNSIIQTQTSSEDYSSVKLVEALLDLKNTDPLNSLERAMQLFKELENDAHVAHLVQENIKHTTDFKQSQKSTVIKAWNLYMYYFLLHDFQQKVAFLYNYSDQPNREEGMACLVDSLKHAENVLDLLLNEKKGLSKALRSQVNEIEEGESFITSHLECVLNEINSLIDFPYSEITDLVGPLGTEPQAEQITLITQVIQQTEHAVELMAFLSKPEHGFTLSEKFKNLRLDILSTHADALRNHGFQLYEKDPAQAIDSLSRASAAYGVLLSLKPKDTVFKEAQEICQGFISGKKPARKKQGTKRLCVEISKDLAIPSCSNLSTSNPSTPSKASDSQQSNVLISPRTPHSQNFYRKNGPPKKRFCPAFFDTDTAAAPFSQGLTKK